MHEVYISLGVFKQQTINNFKVVFEILIFTCNRVIEHNMQSMLKFKMCISPLYLCVNGWIYDEVNILLGVFKQQIIQYVQQFWNSFFKFWFLHTMEL